MTCSMRLRAKMLAVWGGGYRLAGMITKVWSHLMRQDTWWSYGGGGLTRLELYACLAWMAGCIAAILCVIVSLFDTTAH